MVPSGLLSFTSIHTHTRNHRVVHTYLGMHALNLSFDVDLFHVRFISCWFFASICILFAASSFVRLMLMLKCSCHYIDQFAERVCIFMCTNLWIIQNSMHILSAKNGDTKPLTYTYAWAKALSTLDVSSNALSTNICAEYISFLCVPRWTDSNKNGIKYRDREKAKRSRHSNEATAQK